MKKLNKNLVFENRAWKKADIKRLVSERIPTPQGIKLFYPDSQSVVLEVGYHYPRNSYVIHVYGYKLLDKIPGKLDPCSGGLLGEPEPLTFRDGKAGLHHVKDFLSKLLGMEAIFQ